MCVCASRKFQNVAIFSIFVLETLFFPPRIHHRCVACTITFQLWPCFYAFSFVVVFCFTLWWKCELHSSSNFYFYGCRTYAHTFIHVKFYEILANMVREKMSSIDARRFHVVKRTNLQCKNTEQCNA